MNGSFDAKICHTDVKFHGVVQTNVKQILSNASRHIAFGSFHNNNNNNNNLKLGC